MILNFILALIWLMLALGSFLYMLLHPGGGRMVIFGKEFSAIWVALFALIMFGFRLLRCWLIRIQQREQENSRRNAGRTRRRQEEPNPDFDFSDHSEKRDTSLE
ncbi:MAG TPA: hypothetical protein VNX28_13765 [Gemmataceae bacterium]|nr:hypothetical protein [Gemmataceae bacterium]